MSKGLNRKRIEGDEEDKFNIIKFDHLEWFVGDAISSLQIFKYGLGMNVVAESRHETGNHTYCSYVLETGDVSWVLTSPYLSEFKHPSNTMPNPSFDEKYVSGFLTQHGSGVAVIGITVEDARSAYAISTQNGAPGMVEPIELFAGEGSSVVIAEIQIYGDTRIRFVQRNNYTAKYLPGYKPVNDPKPINYKIMRMDHVVGNTYDMDKAVSNLKKYLGLHTFSKFSKEDIQTEYTSLNSEVLANNYENVLLPINEHAKKKMQSQILEYLNAYNGEGVQHIALFTSNIVETMEYMTNAPVGYAFIPTPSPYYEDEIIKKRMDEHLSPETQELIKKYGVLIDEDDEGVLLQIFTKPLFDRPTIFVEIIERVCKGVLIDKAGCGGFGKGNFRALFESIEILQKERDMLLEE